MEELNSKVWDHLDEYFQSYKGLFLRKIRKMYGIYDVELSFYRLVAFGECHINYLHILKAYIMYIKTTCHLLPLLTLA